MHVSRPSPDISINIPSLSPAMQPALPGCGIITFLENLKIDMIYREKERRGCKNCQEIMHLFK
jgi:hypothetical protein